MSITVARNVTASSLRDDLTSTVGAVTYGRQRVGITRHGKLVAVMVPVEDVELLERLEDEADVRAYDAAKADDDGGRVSADELFAELG